MFNQFPKEKDISRYRESKNTAKTFQRSKSTENLDHMLKLNALLENFFIIGKNDNNLSKGE